MRLLTLAAVVLLAGPAAATPRDLAKAIDTRLAGPAAPRAEQHELLRRITLDVIGRIPTAAEAEAYLADPDPERHHKLIDALLVHPEMPVHWRVVFHDWLNGALEEKRPGEAEFLAYLEERLAANAPWDRVARELLLPPDDEPRAAYFLASRLGNGDRAAQLDAMTVAVSGVYFGVQMQCAKCHDHPSVPEWKQENYYGLAAFLGRTFTGKAKTGNLPGLTEKTDGEVKFTGRKAGERTARLLFLDGRVIDAPDGRRRALADTGVTAANPYFKRALANRVWKQLTGVGLVEPVDQIHDGNPASHPDLLAALGDDFATHGFDLRRLLAGVMHSEAYLRSSRWAGADPRPPANRYATAALKPLSPAQLAHSVALATGHAEALRAKLDRDRAKLKIDAVTLAHVRKQYERDRDYAAVVARFKQSGDGFQANASHALFLAFNPVIENQLKASPAALVSRLAKATDPGEVARVAYLAVLSRRPTEAEAAAVAAHLATPGVPREQLAREVVWALLAGPEFRFNH